MPPRRRDTQRSGRARRPAASPPAQAGSTPPWLQVRGADLLLRIRVQPRATPEGVAGLHGDRLRLRVSSPPVEGAANARVVQVLAGLMGIPAGLLTVSRGAKSRDKDLLILGAATRAQELAALLLPC
jgi:uncharacterized protein